MRKTRHSATARGVAALLATVAVLQFGPAAGSPGDIFEQAAPVIGSDPPKAQDIGDGDVSVATQTGAMSYSYPVALPPGRNGTKPQLSLNYSSQAPTYGGPLGAGWSMGIPIITEDTSRGRLRTHSIEVELTQTDPRADDEFTSSLAGGRYLVPVVEPPCTGMGCSGGVYKTYRAQNDSSFARYQRMDSASTFRWRVYLTDGSQLIFGDTVVGGINPLQGCTNVSDGYAPLTRMIDKFGNEVLYRYESAVTDECRIAEITWGQNSTIAFPSFARVVFGWASPPLCEYIPVGSTRDFRSGKLIVSGASMLDSITATAYPPGVPASPVHTRQITFAYDQTADDCDRQHAPVRLLTSISESAWGTDSPLVTLPPVTFEYGAPRVELSTVKTWPTAPWGGGITPATVASLAWGYRRTDDRWPTVETMLLDIDGDGLVDHLNNGSTGGSCIAEWQRNPGLDTNGDLQSFGSGGSITLPRLRWQGATTYAPNNPSPPPTGASTPDPNAPHLEACALNGQVTNYRNVFGIPGCHDGSACSYSSNPDAPNKEFCYPYGLECPSGNNNSGSFRTYLAYRWLDVDADGLVDLVAAIHGDIRVYDVVHGNIAGHADDPAPFGAWPACPVQMDRCKDISGACMATAQVCPGEGQPCTTDWQVVNNCLASAPNAACGDLIVPFGYQATREPYTRCEGLYPWIIYKNEGRGNFATTAVIKYSPLPLESDLGDSSMSGAKMASQYHAIMDFDGDGILDAAANQRPDGSGLAQWWQIWLGDGTGGFGPKRYFVPTRQYPDNRFMATDTLVGISGKMTEGTFDINSDGLPDHWLAFSNGNANVAYHDGTGYYLVGATSGPPTGQITTPFSSSPPEYAVTLASQTTYENIQPNPLNGQPVTGGDTRGLNRPVDVDRDGRLDICQRIEPVRHKVFFNVGGQFTAPGVDYPGETSGLERPVHAESIGELYWENTGDLVDFDGDGIPESSYFSGTQFNRVFYDWNLKPPRLLTAVHNGRGAHTEVIYASIHDSKTVTQDSMATWFDGRPKATPTTQWVVRQLRVIDDFAPLGESYTTYAYKNPRHGADDRGRYAFRGFEEVVTESPSFATTTNRYAYDPDWSGRLVETIVRPAVTESATDVHSIDRTTWTSAVLFGGTIKTFHASASEHFVCANGQDEAACEVVDSGQSPGWGYTKTTTTLSALVSDTQATVPLLWAETQSLLQSDDIDQDGDRVTLTEHKLDATDTTYRLVETLVTNQVRVAGAMTTYAKSNQSWDPTFRVPLLGTVWVDNDDGHAMTTRHVYDMETGNLIERWKPEQHEANTVATTFQYDDRKLFVATETNELGHQREYVYEYGTGTRVITSGPNVRECTQCVIDATHPEKEQQKIRVDGLGRTIERWATASVGGYEYTLTLRESWSFVDTVVGTTPTSTSHETITDANTRQEKAELDGHGRASKKIVYVQGSAPADEVTTFQYRPDGTLQSVSIPDPSLNTSAVVTYTYGFDSLGRPTSIRRPDNASPASQSGIDITYDGMTSTTTEVVGAANGNPASTKKVNDRLGRLVDVHEQTSASTWAITHYTYDAADNVASVVDPEGVTTTLVHDFADRRTAITRSGRTWTYTYDKNGNMIGEQVPGSPNPASDADYTTFTTYDELDRPISRLIGQRDLQLADQEAFGNNTVTLDYDVGGNMKGYLNRFRSWGPSAPSPTVAHDLRVNDDGQPLTTTATLEIAGYAPITRSFARTYDRAGAVVETEFYDWPAKPASKTRSIHEYDARLFPRRVSIIRPGETPSCNRSRFLAVPARDLCRC